MAFERQWNAVPPITLTADGSATGVIQVSDTIGFYVKMNAQLSNSLGQTLTVEIKRVINKNILLVGPPRTPITTYTDCSAFTVALSSTISAAQQNKTALSMEDRMLATYEQEPVNSWRTTQVDPYGNPYTADNPLPTSATFTGTIGDVTVVGPSPDSYPLIPNPDGSINVDLNGLSAFQTSQYTVGTFPVQITPTPLPDRSSVGLKAITTTSSDIIYIGNSSSVTTSTGWPLFNDDALELDLNDGDTIWAVGTSPGQTLCAIELGN